jgi:hypothetical protein
MRLAGILLVVALLGSATARADTPLPFEIVRMLPETNQVLVYDRAHNTHVLLQPGSMFEDYVVVDINGLGMTVEKQQQRYLVYPHEAKYLALNVLPPPANAPAPPPVIYGTSPAPMVPDRLASAHSSEIEIHATTHVARELAEVLAQTSPPPTHGRHRPHAPSFTRR